MSLNKGVDLELKKRNLRVLESSKNLNRYLQSNEKSRFGASLPPKLQIGKESQKSLKLNISYEKRRSESSVELRSAPIGTFQRSLEPGSDFQKIQMFKDKRKK